VEAALPRHAACHTQVRGTLVQERAAAAAAISPGVTSALAAPQPQKFEYIYSYDVHIRVIWNLTMPVIVTGFDAWYPCCDAVPTQHPCDWSNCSLLSYRLDVEEGTADCEVKLDSFERTQLASDIAIIHVPVSSMSDRARRCGW
jgi:hypothetical protein